MKLTNILIAIAAALVALFLALNWQLLGTPMSVSFGFAHASLPLGIVLCGFAVTLVAIFLFALLRMQVQALSTHRRHSAELRSQRELAENAESSRITELRQFLQQEMAALREEHQRAEQRLHEEILTTGRTLSACVGEIDERLERHFPVEPAERP